MPSKTPYDPRHMLEGKACKLQPDISNAFNFPTTSDKCKKSNKMFWMSLGRGMAGTTTPEGGKLTGFFDEGTFKESLRSNSILAPG